MPIFEYTALTAEGKTVSDIIDAESISAARQKLRAARIYPVSIKEVSETAGKRKKGQSVLDLPVLGRKVKSSELAIMTRQLATLIGAGFPLVPAIATLIPQAGSTTLKQILSEIKDAIEEGASFASALSKHRDIFSEIYINMVRAGESSGTLDLVLNRLADVMERQEELKNQIFAAMTYPVLMLFVGSGILFFLLTNIVPQVTSIYADMGGRLPVITRVLIEISSFFRAYWWAVIACLVAMIIAFVLFKRSDRGQEIYDRIILKVPLIGELKRKLAVARFAGTLGSLTENGVSLLVALKIVENIVGNRIIANAVSEAASEVEKGSGLNRALARSSVFPHIAVQMIQVGENSGRLEEMLGKIADIYEKEVQTTVSAMTAIMEPFIILVMAVVVGFIVLAVCLPIFKMSQLIH